MMKSGDQVITLHFHTLSRIFASYSNYTPKYASTFAVFRLLTKQKFSFSRSDLENSELPTQHTTNPQHPPVAPQQPVPPTDENSLNLNHHHHHQQAAHHQQVACFM